MARDLRTNERIRISPIRLIDESNEQLGIVSTDQAMNQARELGLDLVEVAPTERPPVCRIMDYGKWKYQQKKKHKGNQSHEVQIKEVRIRPKTDENDRKIKMNRAHKFLGEGDKVQFTMIFRGRERFHLDRGLSILKDIAKELEPTAKVERYPKMEGRRMTMLLAPLKLPSKPKPPKKHKATKDSSKSSKPSVEPAKVPSAEPVPESTAPESAAPVVSSTALPPEPPVAPSAAPPPEPPVAPSAAPPPEPPVAAES